MKNGSQPLKLLDRARRSGKRVISRADLLKLAKGISHADRAMARLVDDGLVEKLDRGVWLVPSNTRPHFDIPRFWSNPDLSDRRIISALVVSRPSLRDVARLVLAYGTAPAEAALSELEATGEIRPPAAAASRRMLANAKQGFVDAAHRSTAA